MVYQNLSNWRAKFDPYSKIIFIYKKKLLTGWEKYQIMDWICWGVGEFKIEAVY